jgi:DNA-binding MarR family transcriptional regulator
MHRQLLLNMLRAVYWYCDALQDNLEAQGYRRTSRAMAFVMFNIAQGEHRASNIARNLGISRQAVGQMLTELKNRNVIAVSEDPGNRRSRIVDFTSEFAEEGAACAEILTKLDADVSACVGNGDFRAMERALSKVWGTRRIFGRLTERELREGRAEWRADEPSEQGTKALAQGGGRASKTRARKKAISRPATGNRGKPRRVRKHP